MEAIYVSTGRRIKRLREQKDMSQAALGKRIKLRRSSVANMENGRQRIGLHQLVVIGRVLGTTPAALIGGAS